MDEEYKDWLKSVGSAIKEERLNQGLSQRTLGSMTGIDHGNISRIESGAEKNPGMQRIWKIASALGIPVDKLL